MAKIPRVRLCRPDSQMNKLDQYQRRLEDVNLNNAKGMLVNISASSEFKMKEYHEVMNIIKQYAAENAHVIVGNVIDDAMGNHIRVTMVATGLAYQKEEATLNIKFFYTKFIFF